MASSSSLASHPSKYDVFLNFRGDDTRRNFTSHLYAALLQKDLQTFFDEDDLKRGDEIVRSLPQAIQNSTVAVLVFSKDYASSSWCLDELAEIITYHRSRRQIVIPIFYEVNPSHLRKISHDVAAAFVKHEQNPEKAHKIPSWRAALKKAASLSGFDSKQFRNDHMLINKIVEDILQKLNRSMACDGFEHLVGMDLHVKEIKEAFTIDPLKVRILGICGMGGIGKTATAEVIYHELSCQFQDCCFVRNVRQNSDIGGIEKLQEEIISKVLGKKDLGQYISAGYGSFLRKILGRKKILIVLDDVNDLMQIECLIGNPCWFGSGSMVVITSRDKQIFRGMTAFIYEVKPLNHDESLQLFSKSAFKENYPKDDYVSLSKSIVEYAQGNPLALKVLGSSLIGKKQNEWRSALKQLSKVSNKKIQDVLQISYERLNRVEKDVFLDIACFFKFASMGHVKEVLKSCDIDVDIIISVLEEKCLVYTLGPNILEMHDLLQKMGQEIVRQEAEYPNLRSRLWDPRDIYEVFLNNKDAEAVKSIILDSSKIQKMTLNPQVFMKMPNLKYLSFYGESNLDLSQGLDYLPNTLRYFRWDKYPLESFPPNFHPENLVVLILSNSNIKQLWNGAKKNSAVSQDTYGIRRIIVNSFWKLVRLTSLSLVNNQSITHFPNSRSVFLEALEVLKLSGCSNLSTFLEISSNIKTLLLDMTAIKHVPSSSVELLSKLEWLSMEDCRELESLPSITHLPNSRSVLLEALEVLYLSGCSNLSTFPEISSTIKTLRLDRTAIKHVPSSSVELLSKLEWLSMEGCRELESLPSNFFGRLTSLKILNLFGCSRFKALPEISEPMDNLKELDLSETAVAKLPISLVNLKGLELIELSNRHRKFACPAGSFDGLTSLSFLEDHDKLDLSIAKRYRSRELPWDWSCLKALDLSGNGFEKIPTMEHLPRLNFLCINNCERLLSLPPLPESVSTLCARDCCSLKEIHTLEQLPLDRQALPEFHFTLRNCFMLHEDKCQAAVNALLRNYSRTPTALLRNYTIPPMGNAQEYFKMIYPGSRIPEWVKYQSMGDSIRIHLPSDWFNHLFMGFAFYLCQHKINLEYDDGDIYGLSYACYFGDNHHSYSQTIFQLDTTDKEHMLVIVDAGLSRWIRREGNFKEHVAFFKFSREKYIIKKCGIIPLYTGRSNQEEFFL